jgi:hypothetical protein
LLFNNLITFTSVLDEFGIDYALGGSGLMYSLNLIDEVNDWDITTDCPQEEVIRALDTYQWEQAPSGDYPFASKYRIHIPEHNIDIIGNFAIQTKEGVCELPSIVSSNWNGISVGSPEIWFVAYTLMGRQTKANYFIIILNVTVQTQLFSINCLLMGFYQKISQKN